MKIFHAGENIRGGVGTVIRNLLQDQSRTYGKDSVLCLIPDSQRADLELFWPGRIYSFGRSGRNVFSFLRFAIEFKKVCLRERPDLIHLHSAFAGFIGRMCLLALWPIYRPRIIYCPHAWAFLRDDSALKKRLYAIIERSFALFTHEIICVSNYEKSEGLRYGLPDWKMHVIHNGVILPELAEKPRKPEDEISLLFIGSFDYQKGIDILLDAMKKLENDPVHLIAVGNVQEQGSVRPLARPNVYYAGWVTRDKVAAYYDSADVLVVPSRWEGFAMAPIEAMSRGLPVLASNCSSLPEVVVSGKNGILFPKEDVDALASILRSTSAEEWKRMGREARIFCAENFNAEKMCVLTRRLYDECMSKIGKKKRAPA